MTSSIYIECVQVFVWLMFVVCVSELIDQFNGGNNSFVFLSIIELLVDEDKLKVEQ